MDVRRAAAAPSAPQDPADDIRAQLRELTLRQQRFERFLGRRLHVDPAGLAVMDHLVNVAPTTPSELARHLGTSTAAMTLVIDRLAAGGHVRREPHPTDRRKVVVVPAEEWPDTAFAYVAPLVAGITAATDELAPDERAVVARFLARAVAAYDTATPS
ncbi:MarR family winged helix-turn-helix transcriptional regulator [Streptomyces sp. NPDC087440]|uniref:MarR family winged helix-turn-helix transcriptional regulator n=1 Tax=Streptomyces sp. NPDC087440 TaxID=3365790 RepID=UPI00382E81A4